MLEQILRKAALHLKPIRYEICYKNEAENWQVEDFYCREVALNQAFKHDENGQEFLLCSVHGFLGKEFTEPVIKLLMSNMEHPQHY